MFRRCFFLFVAVLDMAPASARADCVDINADPPDRLTAIAHIDDERAVQLISGRPWPSVRSLTGINGIGRGRIRDILEQDLACVGVRAPRGQRETRTKIRETGHQLIKSF